MNYATARSLADSKLAELRTSNAHGTESPDPQTTVSKTVYLGPRGKGWEVSVRQKGKVLDITTTRHIGGESWRNRPDLSFDDLKAQAIAKLHTLGVTKDVSSVRPVIEAAASMDDLLGDSLVDQLPPNISYCIQQAKKHIEASFDWLEIDTMQDKLMVVKAAGAESANPKLIAVYTWLQTVKGMAVAGQIAFPATPYTFEDIVAE